MSGGRGCRPLRKGGADKCDLAARLRLAAGAELARGARPFLEDAVGPERGEEAGPCHGQQDLAQDRRVEHAGVEDDLHPSSRKNSALR